MRHAIPIVLVVLAISTFISASADDEGWNESGIAWASPDAAWDERGNKVRLQSNRKLGGYKCQP